MAGRTSELANGRGKRNESEKEKERYSIKRNGGLANIYLSVGLKLREKRKEPCENVPCAGWPLSRHRNAESSRDTITPLGDQK